MDAKTKNTFSRSNKHHVAQPQQSKQKNWRSEKEYCKPKCEAMDENFAPVLCLKGPHDNGASHVIHVAQMK